MKPNFVGTIIILMIVTVFGFVYINQHGAFSTIPSGKDQVAQVPCASETPRAPTNLIVLKATSNQINLTWSDNSDNEEGFIIEGGLTSLTSQGTWPIMRTPPNQTNFQVTGLTPATSYSYRIRAYNCIGNSPFTSVVNTTTLTQSVTDETQLFETAPASPTNLTATRDSQNPTSQINLSWVDNSNNESSFVISHSTNNRSWYKLVETGPNITAFSHTGLLAGTTHYYRIRSFNNVDYSRSSVVASATTLSNSIKDTIPPTLTMLSPIPVTTASMPGAVIYEITPTGDIVVRVSATDNIGIASVTFERDCNNPNYLKDGNCTKGVFLGTVTRAPYKITIPKDSLTTGIHELFAKTADQAGNEAYDPVSITIGANPGTIAITNIGIEGKVYNLQRRTNLIVGTWTTFATYTGSFVYQQPVSSQPEFFQIVEASTVTNCVPDSTSPSTVITTTGTINSSSARLSADVKEGKCLGKVDFYVDNAGGWVSVASTVVNGTSTTASVTFDTTAFSNGDHTILAYTYDKTGTFSSFGTAPITITNVLTDPGVSLFLKEIVRPTSTGEAGGSAVKTDNQGNTIVVGNFRGQVTFKDPVGTNNVTKTSLGGSDIFIQKFSSNGSLLWTKTFGGTSEDGVLGVAVDASGDIFITGAFFGTANFGGGALTSTADIFGSDIFVARYSSNGTHVWSKKLGGRLGNNSGSSIAVDPTGNVIVGGVFYGEADLGGGLILSRAGSTDGFVVKLAGLTGAYIWAKDFGGTVSDSVKGLAVDSLGDVVVVGYGYASIDFGGGSRPNAGGADLFVVKYAGVDGHHLWSRVAGNFGPDTAEGVAVDSNQNIFVTGSFYSVVDLGGATTSAPFDSGTYVAKYNNVGSLQWARSIAFETTPGAVISRGIAVDSNKNVAITGIASGAVNFGSGQVTYGDANIFIAKYNPMGNYLWAKRSGNRNRSSGNSLTMDNDRNVYSTGSIQGEVSIDGLPISSPGGEIKSTFLYKVSP